MEIKNLVIRTKKKILFFRDCDFLIMPLFVSAGSKDCRDRRKLNLKRACLQHKKSFIRRLLCNKLYLKILSIVQDHIKNELSVLLIRFNFTLVY